MIPDVDKLISDLGAEIFRDPGGHAFATLNKDKRRRTVPVKGHVFHGAIRKQIAKSYGDAYPRDISQVIDSVETSAILDGPTHKVYRRVAYLDGTLYLDLCNDEGLVVKITEEGWAVRQDTYIRFVRGANALPLPIPCPNGSIDPLRELLNAKDDRTWLLMKAWLLTVLQPFGAQPILILQGEQDSGKTTTARMLRGVLDPTEDQVRRLPATEREMGIAASRNHILAFDNLSRITRKQSDMLCVVSTGGSIATRQLYTDAEEYILKVRNPIILNGIDDIAERPDLLNRSIVLHLEPIEVRRTEHELECAFKSYWAGAVGALLDAACVGLCNYSEIDSSSLPRMADSAQWLLACEPGLDGTRGQMLEAYEENISSNEIRQLGLSDLATLFQSFVHKHTNSGAIAFEGTPSALQRQLEKLDSTGAVPRSPNWLMNYLRRIGPLLRRQYGIVIETDRTQHQRKVTVRRIGEGLIE